MLSDNSRKDKKKKPKRKVNWREYNESLVRRGEMLFDSGFLQNWRAELKENEQRKGRPSLSLPEFLDIAARHRTCVPISIPSIRGLSSNDVNSYKEVPGTVPDFTTIWWRVERTKINLDPNINPEKDDIVIAVDSTGIKVTNRGEWILDKWKNKKRMRKGFIKIHVAVDIKTKKIV